MAKKDKKQNIDEVEEIKNDIEEIDELAEIEDEEEKEVTVMDMLNRIVVCLIVIAIILAVNTVVLICKNGESSKENTNTTNSSSNSSTDNSTNYDVSMMKEVDISDVLDMFKDTKGTYVLYIGRSDCSACITYLPSLQQAQANLGYTTQYLDLNKLDTKSSNYESLVSKLTLKYTMTISGTEQTETFGKWMGYTPMTIIIKNGKMVDGEIGAITYDTLVDMLKENGIE